MRRSNLKSPEELEALYADKMNEVEYKLETLKSLLDGHSQDDRHHYGHIGDLAYVSEQLNEAIEFLGGKRALE